MTISEQVLEEGGVYLGRIIPAKPEDVTKVLAAAENDPDGRSQFVWLRLANGDLMLGVFPQGDTYCEVGDFLP
jgi:hypothetical protein